MDKNLLRYFFIYLLILCNIPILAQEGFNIGDTIKVGRLVTYRVKDLSVYSGTVTLTTLSDKEYKVIQDKFFNDDVRNLIFLKDSVDFEFGASKFRINNYSVSWIGKYGYNNSYSNFGAGIGSLAGMTTGILLYAKKDQFWGPFLGGTLIGGAIGYLICLPFKSWGIVESKKY
jgi:hypothetical protein